MNDASMINPDLTLENLGLDSLMVAEIMRTLQQYYDISMSVEKIRTLTFAKLDQLSTSAGGATSTALEEPATASPSLPN